MQPSFQKIFWPLFVVMLGLALFLSVNRFFDHDEFEAVHSAWKMMQGERIYVDFANQHHPFFYYILMPFIRIFGETTQAILAMRVLMFGMYALILCGTYHLALDVFGKSTARLSALLLGTTLIFLHKAIEIRPDVPQAVFGIAGFVFFTRYLLSYKRKDLLVSAALMAVSFLFLQKALFAIIVIGIVLLGAAYRKIVPVKDVMIFTGVFVAVCLPYFTHLFATGSFEAYVAWNWIMNMKLDVHFPPYKFLIGTFRDNAILWLFYGLGIFVFLKTPVQRLVGGASVFLLMSVFLVPAPSQQYYMMALPFVAVIAAEAIREIFSRDERMFTAASAIAVLIPIASVAYDMTNSLSGGMYNTRQLRQIDYVLSITKPGDYVYDGDIQFNVYRKDLDFFWFSVSPKEGQLSTYQKWKGYEYDIFNLIEQKKPKVISDYTIAKQLDDPRISKHYTPSQQFSGLLIRND